jgi:hypothetical protein
MLIDGSMIMNCGSGDIYIYITIYMKPLCIFIHFSGEQKSLKIWILCIRGPTTWYSKSTAHVTKFYEIKAHTT